MKKTTIYQKHGFETRQDYLEDLADEYSVSIDTVMALAKLLGDDEDFDGLVSALRELDDFDDF